MDDTQDAPGTPAGPRSSLEPRPSEANADALRIYPKRRYLAARNGEVSLREFAKDLARHVEGQLPARHVAAGRPATIRR